MGFRFRYRIKIMPGIYINLGKNGINSISGRAGPFTTNFSRGGIKHTFGLHGTGLSFETKKTPWFSHPDGKPKYQLRPWVYVAGVALLTYLVSLVIPV